MNKKVKELRKEISRLKKMVVKDEVTGILNRRGFYERISEFFNDVVFFKKDRVPREKRKEFVVKDLAILFIDIDNLKRINDIYGHAAGDKVIKIVAKIIEGNIRKSDFAGRWGGDEFVVGLVGSTEGSAFKVAQIIKDKSLEDKRISTYKGVKTSLSIGAAEVDDSVLSIDDLIDRADRAMYEGKHKKGKNFIVKYSEIS